MGVQIFYVSNGCKKFRCQVGVKNI